MAKLAPTQIEQLQTIGAYLRQVRQEQGLSLEVLANQIFIRPALLHALEAGIDGDLPEPVFIQGFIRRYAEALGLDGQTISQEFRVTPVDVLPTPELLTTADANGAVEPKPRHSTKVLEPDPPTPAVGSSRNLSLPWGLGLAALAVVLGLGLWGLVGRSNAPSQATGNNDGAETVVEPTDASADTDTDTDAAPLDPPEAEASAPLEAPVVVSASLNERAWLSVVADGQTVYEGIAESGFEDTWTAQTSVVFRTGNAGGVELSVNGDRAVTLGSSGVVRTLTLTPNSGADNLQSP
ncbi:helix-turn-helix domain-containing protein [Nodosilinea sp. E11]|uniref:helix-turn-helix domain-containing protein n=1 Tax=Nodosilinea sp. E11 TaxID=3037479 RepID=UPI00293465D4|nr:RodZ domain-containing protein [Nodosilinea sp. E11]WOD38559.1 DUF4115 domain-containing protein [Nodosilinea sp. E11]